MFRRVAKGELSAEEVCARVAENPEYLGNWEVCEVAQEMACGGESDDKTLTESMAAASISGSAQAGSTYATLPRPLLPRPTPPHIVLFQRGGPQALEMFEAPLPPPPPAWNLNPNDEHFIYEAEPHESSASPPSPATGEDVAEEDEQVDAVAEETEEEEDSEARTLPAWHQAHNRRRARQLLALINQDVLDAMPTDNLIWIMQAGFHNLMSRGVHH